MGRGGNKKFKSDEIRTANVLICGSEATERLCLRSLSDMTLSPHPDNTQSRIAMEAPDAQTLPFFLMPLPCPILA